MDIIVFHYTIYDFRELHEKGKDKSYCKIYHGYFQVDKEKNREYKSMGYIGLTYILEPIIKSYNDEPFRVSRLSHKGGSSSTTIRFFELDYSGTIRIILMTTD